MFHLLYESQKIHASFITEIKLCQNLNTSLTHFHEHQSLHDAEMNFALEIPVRNQQIYLRNEIISFMRIFKMEQAISKELAVFCDASSFEIPTISVENAWSLSVIASCLS